MSTDVRYKWPHATRARARQRSSLALYVCKTLVLSPITRPAAPPMPVFLVTWVRKPLNRHMISACTFKPMPKASWKNNARCPSTLLLPAPLVWVPILPPWPPNAMSSSAMPSRASAPKSTPTGSATDAHIRLMDYSSAAMHPEPAAVIA